MVSCEFTDWPQTVVLMIDDYIFQGSQIQVEN